MRWGSWAPEAIALYRKLGYVEIDKFGHYADEPESLSLGKVLDASKVATPTAT